MDGWIIPVVFAPLMTHPPLYSRDHLSYIATGPPGLMPCSSVAILMLLIKTHVPGSFVIKQVNDCIDEKAYP